MSLVMIASVVFSPAKSHYDTKIRDDIHNASCYLGLQPMSSQFATEIFLILYLQILYDNAVVISDLECSLPGYFHLAQHILTTFSQLSRYSQFCPHIARLRSMQTLLLNDFTL